jgi:pyrimidine-nucleoside phosphorylase
MSVLDAIAAKRDGRANTDAQLRLIANGAADGSIPDYQLSAWLMAVYINGLSEIETAQLTVAMAESGERIDLSGLDKPWMDKHSTGGIGDKTTLILLPLLAACGLTMVKMSGRGLGITGGTIDKLESVPGFRTNLSPEEMKSQASRIGIALTGQTPRLAPADGVLYSLRDTTGTVTCEPLIISSILSKKIAGGADHVVFDVKCGSGGFLNDKFQADVLRQGLIRVGKEAGLEVRAAITDMSQPLGRTAGNALEVKEAISVLRGEPGRVRDLCLHLASLALDSAGINADPAAVLESGAALAKAKEWFAAQGAELAVFDSDDWCLSDHTFKVTRQGEAGWVSKVCAEEIGKLVVRLGGGRRAKTDHVDPTVGVEIHVEVGDKVEPGDKLLTIHSAEEFDGQVSVEVSADPVERTPVILS